MIFSNSRHVRNIVQQIPIKDTEAGMLGVQPTTDRRRNTYPTYVTKAGDTLELLAFKLYGDANKWYALARANPEIEWPLDVTPGTELKIPPRAKVLYG